MILETGTGIRGANSYVDIAFATSYLTSRNRSQENGWDTATQAQREAALISGSQYADLRFGSKFPGYPCADIKAEYAVGKINFTSNPSPGQTITVADTIYQFVSSLADIDNQILIDATANQTAQNFTDAINGVAAMQGTKYSLGTLQSRHCAANLVGALVTLTLTISGASGNLTVLETTSSNNITTFTGGLNAGSSLLWPRYSAFDRYGNELVGIPEILKQAVTEYAVRALFEPLLPDPEFDAFAGRIQQKIEQVGPIREETKYDAGTMGEIQFRSFPVADGLMKKLLRFSGKGVIRG